MLVDFWEYTCINCLRTLPYLREWYQRYRDQGFVIVGVHTPEFGFSGERANVAAAAKRLDVTWPIVLDDVRDLETLRQLDLAARISLQPKRRLVESVVGEGGVPADRGDDSGPAASRESERGLPAGHGAASAG